MVGVPLAIAGVGVIGFGVDWTQASVAAMDNPGPGSSGETTGNSVTPEEALERHRRELGTDPAIGGKFRPGEGDSGIRIENERGIQLTRLPKEERADWIGSDGKTYDAVGNFPGKFFDQQWQQLQLQISRHLGRADFVPVDVPQFTAGQVARVRAYIAQYGDRVFMIGEK